MRPNAEVFSPSPVSTPTLSVVQYTSDGESTKEEREKAQETVDHEVITRLIGEVHKLNRRCDILEAENAALRADTAALQSGIHSTDSDNGAVKSTLNLTGYASSDTFEDGPESASQGTIHALKKHVDHHVMTVEQILEKFRDFLFDEREARKTLAKDFERTRLDLTSVKGRVGSHDKKLKDQEDPIEDVVALSFQAKKYSAGTDEGSNGLAIREVKEELNIVRQQRSDLRKEICISGKMVVTSSGQADSADGLAQVLPVVYSKLDELGTELQQLRDYQSLKAAQHAKIDDASTKDALYQYYQQLSRDLEAIEDEQRVTGPFKGNYDELWALRDRVLCRVVVFDKYGNAMRDAKKAWVDA